MAHHDIVNPNSENCNDNSASVCNLLQFIKEVKENNKQLKENIYVVFTDCEECGGKGSKRLSERIKQGLFQNVECIINLELTAVGQSVYCELINPNKSYKRLLETHKKNCTPNDLFEFRTPPQDAWYIRQQNIDCINIGIVDFKDVPEIIKKGFCGTWGVCHKLDDRFSNANNDDMDRFVKYLHGFCNLIQTDGV